MPRLLRRDPARFFAAASVASFGVLGWLLVQWLTVSMAEHAHLGAAVESHHHHAYAGPLAVVMALTATCSLLGVLAVRLRPGYEGTDASRASKLVLAAASSAAGLFVLVESFELQLMGREHDSSAMAFLIAGATLQFLVLPLSWALSRGAVAITERCADRLRRPSGIRVPTLWANRFATPPSVVAQPDSRTQRVRGPPAPLRLHFLLPTVESAPV